MEPPPHLPHTRGGHSGSHLRRCLCLCPLRPGTEFPREFWPVDAFPRETTHSDRFEDLRIGLCTLQGKLQRPQLQTGRGCAGRQSWARSCCFTVKRPPCVELELGARRQARVGLGDFSWDPNTSSTRPVILSSPLTDEEITVQSLGTLPSSGTAWWSWALRCLQNHVLDPALSCLLTAPVIEGLPLF